MDDVGPFPAFPAQEVQWRQPDILWIWVLVWARAAGMVTIKSRNTGKLLLPLPNFMFFLQGI
jgi:hypothetical protein